MEEISAGGVVIHEDEVLILKKYRGDWVLPKGDWKTARRGKMPRFAKFMKNPASRRYPDTSVL